MPPYRIHIRPGSQADKLGLTAVSVWSQWPQEGRSPDEDGKEFGRYLAENGDLRFIEAMLPPLHSALVAFELPEQGQKCFRCDASAVVRVGADKTPLCQEDFEKFLEGFGKVLKKIQELVP